MRMRRPVRRKTPMWSWPSLDIHCDRILRFIEPDTLDWSYLHRWTALHGTRAALDTIRASVSTID